VRKLRQYRAHEMRIFLLIEKQRASLVFPLTRCLPAGVPAGMFICAFKTIQAPREIVALLEDGDPPRQIHADWRSFRKDPQPSWMGYSVGKWQADTLAVETIGLNDQSWLDGSGHPRSESMHNRRALSPSRFRAHGSKVTLEDPAYYTRPFTVKTELNLIPTATPSKFAWTQNEKDWADSEAVTAGGMLAHPCNSKARPPLLS